MFRPPIDTLMDQIIATYGDVPDEWTENEFMDIEELIYYDDFMEELSREYI